MMSCRTETETVSRMQKAGLFDCCCSHLSVASPSLCLWRGFTVDILSTFCGVFMVQCAKLMLRIFEFWVSLFECFVYRQNVTCLKRFTTGAWQTDGRTNRIIRAVKNDASPVSQEAHWTDFCKIWSDGVSPWRNWRHQWKSGLSPHFIVPL